MPDSLEQYNKMVAEAEARRQAEARAREAAAQAAAAAKAQETLTLEKYNELANQAQNKKPPAPPAPPKPVNQPIPTLEKYNELANQAQNKKPPAQQTQPVKPENPLITSSVENNKPPKPPVFNPDGKTVTINGVAYGVGKPLEGEYIYYDSNVGGLMTGVYVPPKYTGFDQPSQATQDLLKKIIKETGCTLEEAMGAISHVVNGTEINGKVFQGQQGNALINRYPKLLSLIGNNAKGIVWKDFKKGVPMIATQENTTASGKPTGEYSETLVVLSFDDAEKISKLSPAEQFAALKAKGIYPSSWEYEVFVNKSGGTAGNIFRQTLNQERAMTALNKAGVLDRNGSLIIEKAAEKNLWNAVKQSGHFGGAYEQWIKTNIKTDAYLNSILEKKGEDVAIGAWLKRQTDLKAIRDRWVKRNIKSDEYLNRLLIREGETEAIKAYKKRYADLNKISQRAFDKWINNEAPNNLRIAYETGGIEGYNKAVASLKQQTNNALELMEPYKTQDGKYRVYNALNDASTYASYGHDPDRFEKQDAMINAVKLLFEKKELERITKYQTWLLTGRNMSIKDEGGGGVIDDFWRNAQAAIPAGLVVTAGYTKQTPIPQDDLIALIVLTAVGGTAAIIDAVKKHRAKTGAAPSVNNIAYIDNYNNLKILDPINVNPKIQTVLDKIQLTQDKKIFSEPLGGGKTFTDEELSGNTGSRYSKPFEVFKEGISTVVPQNVKGIYLVSTPTTKTGIEDLAVVRAELLKAEEKVKANIPETITTSINWDKILNRDLQKRHLKEKYSSSGNPRRASALEASRKVQERLLARYRDEVLRASSISNKITQEQVKLFETAHQEYLRKLALWRAAWQSYVKSIDPTPIKGDVTPGVKAAIAESMLQDVKENAKEVVNPGDQQLSETELVNTVKTIYQESLQQALKSLSKSATKAQIQQALKTAQQQALKTAMRQMAKNQTKSQTKTQTKTQLQQAVKTALQQAVAQATATAIRTATKTATAEKTSTTELPDELTTELTTTTELTGGEGVKIPRPDNTAPEKEKQKFLSGVKGIVARRRGLFYLVDFYPYGPKDKMVTKTAPRGIKPATGKGSLNKSATLLYGIPPSKPLFRDTGAVDDIITVKNKKVSVKSVKDPDVNRKRRIPKPFKLPKEIEQPDGIVFNPRTGKGHLKI
jgi:hypothetical protein